MAETQLHNHRTTAAMNITNKNRSISDVDSQLSQADSFHSPLPSPFHLDSKAIVVDKYYTPLPSPPLSPPEKTNHRKQQRHGNLNSKIMIDRAVTAGATPVEPAGVSEGSVGGVMRRSRKDATMGKTALLLRVCEVILCVTSFCIMAADKTEGWSGDSYYRYKEYRYCLAVAVISFLYSGLQASDLAYHLATGKHFLPHHLRNHFDFLMDQILAYLVLSASSSGATRVDTWVSNWGQDQFTLMASASIGVSFLAFAAFALSSLISGYNLCCHVSSLFC